MPTSTFSFLEMRADPANNSEPQVFGCNVLPADMPGLIKE